MGYEKMARDTLFSGESKNVEYKVTLPDKSEKYMKTIVAFANTQGGKLIVGIDDKTHEIVGVENEILFQVMDGIANFNAAKEYGLLEGISGIGLLLLSLCISDFRNAQWMKFFLLN